MEISVIKIYCSRRFLTQVRPSGCEWYFRGVWWGPSQCILTLQMGSVNWLRGWGGRGGGAREPNNRRLNDVVRPGAGFDSIHFEPDKGCVAALVQWGAVKIYHVASSVWLCLSCICPHGQGVDSLNVMIELDHFCLLLLINWLICWLFKWFQFSNKQVIDQHGGSVVQ